MTKKFLKPKRAGRAAAPVKAVNQIHSPQVLNQQVQQQQQQQQSQQNAPPAPPPSKVNKQPPVNPYMPKSGTSPILQQQTPAVHKSGIAAPNVNVPHAKQLCSTIEFICISTTSTKSKD